MNQPPVYPKKYAHGFVVLCFVVVMQSFIMNSHEVFIHIHHGCFAGTGAIVRLPQCQWSKPDGYGKTSQCITTTKHSKAKTVCIFLGIYCMCQPFNIISWCGLWRHQVDNLCLVQLINRRRVSLNIASAFYGLLSRKYTFISNISNTSYGVITMGVIKYYGDIVLSITSNTLCCAIIVRLLRSVALHHST